MSKEYIASFVEKYKNYLIADNNREDIKEFNRSISSYKYMIIHPYPVADQLGKIQIIVGFGDNPKILSTSKENTLNAFESIRSEIKVITPDEDVSSIAKTFVFETSNIQQIPIENVPWDRLINSEEIGKASFDILTRPFCDMFNLDESTDAIGMFFEDEEKKPKELELKLVWRDVDSYEKYGSSVALIFWKSEFIGWITHSGRWLGTMEAATVNAPKWKDMMNTLFDLVNFKDISNLRGVTVYDMNTTQVDEVVYVPGVSKKSHS
tara:strand:- start:171 stop:965 length:795 start_codon:yes stop_codon:yes gene_type:complete